MTSTGEPFDGESFEDAGAPERYELRSGERRLGLITVTVDDGTAFVDHTETDPAEQGRGLAGRLTAHAVADLRARGLRVVPRCPYTVAWAERHPEIDLG